MGAPAGLLSSVRFTVFGLMTMLSVLSKPPASRAVRTTS